MGDWPRRWPFVVAEITPIRAAKLGRDRLSEGAGLGIAGDLFENGASASNHLFSVLRPNP